LSLQRLPEATAVAETEEAPENAPLPVGEVIDWPGLRPKQASPANSAPWKWRKAILMTPRAVRRRYGPSSPGMPKTARLVALAIVDACTADRHWCRMGLTGLAGRAGLSRNGAIVGTDWLEAHGRIVVDRDETTRNASREANVYHLTVPTAICPVCPSAFNALEGIGSYPDFSGAVLELPSGGARLADARRVESITSEERANASVVLEQLFGLTVRYWNGHARLARLKSVAGAPLVSRVPALAALARAVRDPGVDPETGEVLVGDGGAS
jgi:hypothetical protein